MSETATPFTREAFALYLTGFAAFVGLYLPQPILPFLARDFGVSVQGASLVVSSTILGIALASPLVGVLSDRYGRRRILVGSSVLLALVTFGCSLAHDFALLITLRFIQGVALPGLFAVGVAYASELLPRATMSTVAGLYVAATVIGGMLGRVLAGVLVDLVSWRYGFGLSALLYASLGFLWLRLPTLETKGASLKTALAGTLSHLKSSALLGGLLVGFCLFFAFQATFTYLPFRLERPPFNLSATLIGLTFLTYMSGIFSSGLAGWLRGRARLRLSFGVGFGLAVVGNLVTLAPGLPVILVGLLVLCFGNWLVQGLAVGYVATVTDKDRAGANALYLLFYYLGGSSGAFLPGYVFTAFGYSGVIGLSVLALLLGLVSVALLRESKAP